MKTTYLYLLLAILSVPAFSQTKMGSTNDPEKGTILDLNNSSPDYVGGLKLPNVDIPNLEQIPATFTDLGVAQETNNNLKGLTVYNTNTTTGVGVYIWDGEKWVSMASPSGQISDCGTNGEAKSMKIGNNTYLTHAYHTGANGSLQCWMVENSKEGASYVSTTYPGQNPGERGYYYTWDQATQANNACPDGWSLPNESQFNKLFGLNGETKAIGNANSTTNDARWWYGTGSVGSTYAGYYSISSATWGHWATNGWYWASGNANRYYRGLTNGNLITDTNSDYWLSVRCVK